MNLKKLNQENEKLFNEYCEFGTKFQMEEFTQKDWDKWCEVVKSKIIPNNKLILEQIKGIKELEEWEQHIIGFEEFHNRKPISYIPFPKDLVKNYLTLHF